MTQTPGAGPPSHCFCPRALAPGALSGPEHQNTVPLGISEANCLTSFKSLSNAAFSMVTTIFKMTTNFPAPSHSQGHLPSLWVDWVSVVGKTYHLKSTIYLFIMFIF